MNLTIYLLRLTGFITAIGLVIPTAAQTVLIDLGNDTSYRGLSVDNPDDNGNHWNSLQPGLYYENLIDINNNATTIDFGFSTPVGTDSYNGPAGPTSAGTLLDDVLFTDIDAAALGNLGGALEGPFDYAAGDPAVPEVQFEIQQLDPTKTYDLTFYGSHAFNTDPTTVYSVYTDNTYTTLIDSVSLEVHEPGSPWLHNRDMVATISGLSPQTDNILYVTFKGSAGDIGYLNAMQIETITPEVTGDFNGDGQWDCLDIDSLTAAIASMSSNVSFDMNGDGSVTVADLTDAGVGWLAVGGANNPGATGGNPFLVGDANLDGSVDGQDFLEWNGSKFTANTNWCDGNFNADNAIDGQDFIAWNENKFMSSDALGVAVPEPSCSLMALSILFVGCARTRIRPQ